MHKLLTAGGILIVIAALSAKLVVGQTDDRAELTITVQVSSAEHELQEGYFSLGDSATVMAKPGTDLFKFLSRHRGNKIRIRFSEAARPDLSRLER